MAVYTTQIKPPLKAYTHSKHIGKCQNFIYYFTLIFASALSASAEVKLSEAASTAVTSRLAAVVFKYVFKLYKNCTS